jgi:hypothetical protein
LRSIDCTPTVPQTVKNPTTGPSQTTPEEFAIKGNHVGAKHFYRSAWEKNGPSRPFLRYWNSLQDLYYTSASECKFYLQRVKKKDFIFQAPSPDIRTAFLIGPSTLPLPDISTKDYEAWVTTVHHYLYQHHYNRTNEILKELQTLYAQANEQTRAALDPLWPVGLDQGLPHGYYPPEIDSHDGNTTAIAEATLRDREKKRNLDVTANRSPTPDPTSPEVRKPGRRKRNSGAAEPTNYVGSSETDDCLASAPAVKQPRRGSDANGTTSKFPVEKDAIPRRKRGRPLGSKNKGNTGGK